MTKIKIFPCEEKGLNYHLFCEKTKTRSFNFLNKCFAKLLVDKIFLADNWSFEYEIHFVAKISNFLTKKLKK